MAQMQACLPPPHPTDASAGATIRAMSGPDPRLPWKSATELEHQLERRRLAAEREDAQQEELNLLLDMASKTSEVLSESLTYDVAIGKFTNKDAELAEREEESPAAPGDPASPDAREDDGSAAEPASPTVVPVKQKVQPSSPTLPPVNKTIKKTIRNPSSSSSMKMDQKPVAAKQETAVKLEAADDFDDQIAIALRLLAEDAEEGQAPFAVPDDLKAMKGKGKAGIVSFEDGNEWLFGKRHTFAKGELQEAPVDGQFFRGPAVEAGGADWRSGSGRWGARGGVGKAWNKVKWALHGHDV